MKTTTFTLPNTLEECHALIKQMAQQIAQLQRRAFSSMKDRAVPYTGPTLFDEEFKESELARKQALEQATAEVEAAATKRREQAKRESRAKRPQKYLYSGLREEVRTENPIGVNLDEYDVIGVDRTRLLHYRQAEVWVECIERPILRKKADKSAPNPEIVQALPIRPIIGGNHVAADMLAQLVVNKYCYHLPEYRQVKMLSDLGVTLPRNTLNSWIHAVAAVLYPLYESQCESVRSQSYLQVDEVPWKIADRKGKPCRDGYAWQFRDVSPSSRGTFFYYYKGARAGEIARAQLKDYKGAVQTDGYKVYEYLENVPNVTTLACWAHVRRKFVDAQASNPKAGEVVEYIASLYALEENLRQAGADAEQIKHERQQYAMPILDGIKLWMELTLPQCTPKEPLAMAIKYALRLWERLTRYVDNGIYQIDSNPVERGQRPSVMGRKNYLFSQNDRGAEDNAVFYTLLVSCDILNVNPLEWLTYTLSKIHQDMNEDELIKLLPFNYNKVD